MEVREYQPLNLNTASDADFWQMVLQALLAQVDAIERKLGRSPRTAELRRQWNDQRKNGS